MLLIRCPYCQEERPELEFRNGEEAHIVRPDNITSVSDEVFEDYFFLKDNPRGLTYERWRHVHGCGRFFRAVRHTVTDKFVMTYRQDEPKPDAATIEAAIAAKGDAQ